MNKLNHQITTQDILNELEQLAPFSHQESYDNSGLLVGDRNRIVTGVLVALDCTEAIVEEAIQLGINTIVTHHPIIFNGLKRITGANYVERTVIKAIENQISLIAIHTNLDHQFNGVNRIISEKIGLKNLQILDPKAETLSKLIVFVPNSHAELIQTILSDAGAGKIGNYDSCLFSTTGVGQFRPLDGSKPAIGKINTIEFVEETKIEALIHSHLIPSTLEAIKKAHPYEEVAFDVVQLHNSDHQIGAGMVGELEQAVETIEFLKEIKRLFNCGVIKHTEIVSKEVKRIAVCGGSGSFLLSKAIQSKADVFITSDYKYHDFFDANQQIIIADIGHFESEQYTSACLVSQLNKKFTTFAVRLTNVSTNPINYL